MEISSAVETWAAQKPMSDVEVRIRGPERDQNINDDYVIVREFKFIPKCLAKSQFEIWISEHGRIGIGIERLNRIAHRLKLQNSSTRFAVGCEPSTLPIRDLLQICNIVADGELELVVQSFFGRLVGCSLPPRYAKKLPKIYPIRPWPTMLCNIGLIKRTTLPYSKW